MYHCMLLAFVGLDRLLQGDQGSQLVANGPNEAMVRFNLPFLSIP